MHEHFSFGTKNADKFYFARKVQKVTYIGLSLSGLRGIEIISDGYLPTYELHLLQESHGILIFPVSPFVHTLGCSGHNNRLVETYLVVNGRSAIEQHLKGTDHWEYGINFREKLHTLLATVDTYCNNELKARPGL